MANTQPDLFRIELSFFYGQLHTLFFSQHTYCIIGSSKFLCFNSIALSFPFESILKFSWFKERPMLLRCEELFTLTVNCFSISKRKLYILFGSLRKCMCQETCIISSVSCHVQVTAVTPCPQKYNWFWHFSRLYALSNETYAARNPCIVVVLIILFKL